MTFSFSLIARVGLVITLAFGLGYTARVHAQTEQNVFVEFNTRQFDNHPLGLQFNSETHALNIINTQTQQVLNLFLPEWLKMHFKFLALVFNRARSTVRLINTRTGWTFGHPISIPSDQSKRDITLLAEKIRTMINLPVGSVTFVNASTGEKLKVCKPIDFKAGTCDASKAGQEVPCPGSVKNRCEHPICDCVDRREGGKSRYIIKPTCCTETENAHKFANELALLPSIIIE